jgi:hypothetical protein
VVLNFGYENADNNWWWAVDNLLMTHGSTEVYFQNFESLTLGPPTDEITFQGDPEKLWTAEPPAGWTADRTGVPGYGDDATDGVTEWAGWSFADKDWWIQTAGNQDRIRFTKGEGVVAVADPDEWDDAGHANSMENGWYKTGITSPEIDITGLQAGTVELKFDNSWRPEFDGDYRQSAKIRVSFDGGDPIDLVTWESVNEDGHKTRITTQGGQQTLTTGDLDMANSTEVISVPNPEGAESMKVEFYMYDAGNDWWWAVDNLDVTGLPAVAFACGDNDLDGDIDSADLIDFLANFTGADGTGATFAQGDCDADGDLDVVDELAFIANWTGAQGAGLVELPAGVVGPANLARGAVASVPEPGSLLVLGCGALLTLVGWRRKY